MNSTSTVNLFLFLSSLLQLGYIISFGNYSMGGIFILMACLAIWFVFYFHPKFFKNNLDFYPHYTLYFLLMFSVIFSLILLDPTIQQGGIPFRPSNINEITWIIRGLSVLGLFLCGFSLFLKKRIVAFILLLFIATVLRMLFIYISPNPRIDTYDILRLGSLGLIRGENPYEMSFIPIDEPNYQGIKPDYFSYTPGILILTVPAVLIFKDYRVFFALANTITAIILYLILKRNKQVPSIYSFILPSVFLFNPSSYFIILRGWTDPIVILLLAIIAASLVFKKFNGFILILLSVIVTIKQTLIFIPLFFLKYWGQALFKLSAVVALSSLIITPFIIWSPNDFLHDTIIFHLKNPLRHDALIINNLFYRLTSLDLPSQLLLSTIIIIWIFIFKKQGKKPEDIYLSMGLWYFTFFLFNSKQAFVNYYYFISSLIILYLSLKISNSPYPWNGK